MKKIKRILKSFTLLCVLTINGCSNDVNEEELFFNELIEVENLNDHEALGETFITTIKLPNDVTFDTLIIDDELPDLEIIERGDSIVLKSLVESSGVKKITGKIFATTKDGIKNGYRFFTSYYAFIPSVDVSGTYLIRNEPNEINITGIYGERLDSTIVEMENATYERIGNDFLVTPGNDSLVRISVLAKRNNPPGLVMIGWLDYKVLDK